MFLNRKEKKAKLEYIRKGIETGGCLVFGLSESGKKNKLNNKKKRGIEVLEEYSLLES